MAADPGHVQVQRTLDSIVVGVRHRVDLGDVDALVESIRREGLLQPITVTPDGVLVCGRRRLEALRRLGHRTTNVWVRSGLTDRLSRLLAEQNDNALHKPLSLIEAAALYRELKVVLAEDAAARQEASRFGAPEVVGDEDGGDDSSPPKGPVGKARSQAARMITGRDSHQQFERLGRLQRLADDEAQPARIRAQAAAELERITAGGKVHGAHLRMQAALSLDELDRIAADPTQPAAIRDEAAAGAARVRAADDAVRTAELARLAAEAVARVKAANRATGKRKPARAGAPSGRVPLTIVLLPARAFVAMWDDLAGWTRRYAVQELATALTAEQWARFEQVVAETTAFADALRTARATAVDDGRDGEGVRRAG